MAPLQGCSAFSSLPIRNTNPIPGIYSKSGVNSIHHPHPIKRNMRLNVSSSFHPDQGTLFSTQDVAMAPLHKGCSAFGSLPIRNTNPIPGYYLKSGADSFHHSHPIKRNTRPNVSSSLHPGPGTLFSTQDVERELHGALEFARDMDRKHGLCTGPSQKAWNVVDEIYQTIQTLRDGGEHSNVVQRQSPSELHGALEFARDMDRKHGLCTGPSQKAWNVVDEIYQTIQTLRDGGGIQMLFKDSHQDRMQGEKLCLPAELCPLKERPKEGDISSDAYNA
eukprot:CAMPEP_0201946520 /NCGR_PEP_ID=MMETSP0903-20130614/54461_1 /ASSEMBLY_ACC=CAM_ASM_000552 /TAXON_ID=420261 /ORGANISM="Thalassiosira antarctica, Strain CCMP982" /LENGTH=276 /DNA_ID=CAMNT_0048489621 /DNA_START=257 /DNA_END=1089 /DNA_ORIENTATION=-